MVFPSDDSTAAWNDHFDPSPIPSPPQTRAQPFTAAHINNARSKDFEPLGNVADAIVRSVMREETGQTTRAPKHQRSTTTTRVQLVHHDRAYSYLSTAVQLDGEGRVLDAERMYRTGARELRQALRIRFAEAGEWEHAEPLIEKMQRNLDSVEARLVEMSGGHKRMSRASLSHAP